VNKTNGSGVTGAELDGEALIVWAAWISSDWASLLLQCHSDLKITGKRPASRPNQRTSNATPSPLQEWPAVEAVSSSMQALHGGIGNGIGL